MSKENVKRNDSYAVLLGLEAQARLIDEEPITSFADNNGWYNLITVDRHDGAVTLRQQCQSEITDILIESEDLPRLIDALVSIQSLEKPTVH